MTVAPKKYGTSNLRNDTPLLRIAIISVNALKQASEQNESIEQALAESAEAARQGMEATTPLVARKGRASYLGERSAGHQDPGATSSYLILKAAMDTWAN